MKELTADLWQVPADLRVITTNGTVKKNGAAVMGRGCAKEAKDRYPGIDQMLGKHLRLHGNWPTRLDDEIASLPVKHNWWERADVELIEQSVRGLVILVDRYGYKNVVMPRPGCGNGKLLWEEIKPLIEPLLDDRFTVVDYPEEKS